MLRSPAACSCWHVILKERRPYQEPDSKQITNWRRRNQCAITPSAYGNSEPDDELVDEVVAPLSRPGLCSSLEKETSMQLPPQPIHRTCPREGLQRCSRISGSPNTQARIFHPQGSGR